MKRSGTESRDPFEAALKADAARIRADLPPGLARRIDAALARERPQAARPGSRDPLVRPWLAGSLVGLAVAAGVVLLVGRPGEQHPRPVPAAPAADQSLPLEAFVPLRAETADLTAPLEEELRNLQADLEKARENVERDLRLTF